MKFSVVVPTLNAGNLWQDWIVAVNSQSIKMSKILVVDSGSTDETVKNSLAAGFEVKEIDSSDFGHGKTRQMAVGMLGDHDFLVFLTQDAILAADNSIEKILEPFHDIKVAAICGRQLPRKRATSIEEHARLYNYTLQSNVKSINDVGEFGLKTAFISNSFAAYRISVLSEVGGFPKNVIFGEDMYVAAKMLKAGYKIAYAADACVYHSHDYSLTQEVRRYFDMGVFHAHEPWIRRELGGAEGEGVKFVVSEFKYLLKNAFWRIPEAILRTLFRYAGFRLGLLEKWLPRWLKRQLAMNKSYFK